MDEPTDDDVQLFLAMPRRELFRHTGFVTRIEMVVLDSLADESWYAAPAVLAANHDAKEVRLGMILTRPASAVLGPPVDALVGAGGVLLHRSRIPPEAGDLSQGLVAFKNLAINAGRAVAGIKDGGRVEMRGYLNEEVNPTCRGMVFLVYRMIVEWNTPAPEGMVWAPIAGLDGATLEDISRLALPAIKPAQPAG
jgi:hypothetical protein